jgi:hypothetical protein
MFVQNIFRSDKLGLFSELHNSYILRARIDRCTVYRVMWSLQLSDFKQKCNEVIDFIETASLSVHKSVVIEKEVKRNVLNLTMISTAQIMSHR